RDHMGQGIGASYVQMVRTAWIYLTTGALWRLCRLRKGPVIAALYPVVVLLVQAFVALVCAGAVWASLVPLLGWGMALGLAGVAAAAVLHMGRRLDRRLYAYYLIHDYAYTARHHGAYGPALTARIAKFADQIATAIQPVSNVNAPDAGPPDEVLVIGHSSGAHLAVSALAQVQTQAAEQGGRAPAVSLLTLGHVVPMVTALPHAKDLRADLAVMAQRTDITWVDVTAPGDGCCFALCDPVAVSGVGRSNQRGPLVISARFSDTLGAEQRRALKWRFFRLHFQYLCAFDQVADYDYFAITAGAQTLQSRYAGRAPSPSRITHPSVTGRV
ncbi:MAG: hypothetical protein ACPGFC_10230, partial [Paracoccaceae bacterium]